MNPVWTYNDRGYYSIAFVGKYKPTKIKTLPLDSKCSASVKVFKQVIKVQSCVDTGLGGVVIIIKFVFKENIAVCFPPINQCDGGKIIVSQGDLMIL